MEKEMHELVKEILIDCKCPECAGTIVAQNCVYCGYELPEDKKRRKEENINELNDLIKNNPNLFSYGSKNLAEIFSLSNQCISEVDRTLEKYNFKNLLDKILSSVVTEKIEPESESIFDKMESSGIDMYGIMMRIITLDMSELMESSKYLDVSFNKIKDRCSFIVFRALLDKKITCDVEDMYSLYSGVTRAITSLFGLNIVVDFKQLDDDVKANACGKYINFSKSCISDPPEITLNAAIHEIIHHGQNETMRQRYLNSHTITMAKDQTLMKILGKQYTNENYNASYTLFPHEQEAYNKSPEITLETLKIIGYTPSEKVELEIRNHQNWIKPYVGIPFRIFNGEQIDLDTLFEREVFFHPEIFNNFPQLAFEYKVSGENVVKKSSSELKDDYQKYRSGNIIWNGNSEEICQLYESAIRKQEKIEISSKKDSI